MAIKTFNSATKISSVLILTILLLVVIAAFSFKQLKPTREIATPVSLPNQQNLPDEISPEGVKDLAASNKPFLLVNADDYDPKSLSEPGPIRLIYYTTTPAVRAAKNLTRQDREVTPTDFKEANKQNSQRLQGTPIEWQRTGLAFSRNPIPMQVLKISPVQLSESIQDGVNLQIIDVRPVVPGLSNETPFPKAFRWMPHEVITNLPKLSKDKWIVLVGLSSEDVQPIAFELFQKGYVLTAFLEGGYPAWVSATGR